MLQKEGQVRIPAGCAISGIFHKDGARENGTRIIDSIRTMHDRPTAWAAASQATASIRNTPTTMRFMYFSTRRRQRTSASARSRSISTS